MRRLGKVLLSVLLVMGLSGAGQPAPRRMAALSAADKAALVRVDAYLNAIHTLEGTFLQIGPDGQLDQGKFYLQKPGKMRFEYRAPNPLLIVCDGTTIAVSNSKLKTVDRYPLAGSPLDLILSDNIDLVRSDAVLAVHRDPGVLTIEARSSANRNTANISLTFATPDLELRQWTVLDDQGGQTTVTLDNLQPGAAIPPWLFVLQDKKAVGTKQRD